MTNTHAKILIGMKDSNPSGTKSASSQENAMPNLDRPQSFEVLISHGYQNSLFRLHSHDKCFLADIGNPKWIEKPIIIDDYYRTPAISA
jgi:hypothetical protein